MKSNIIESIIISLLISLLTFYLTEQVTFSIISGIVTYLIYRYFRSERRYWRAFGKLFIALITTSGYSLEFVKSVTNGKFEVKFEESITVSVIIGILMVLMAILDYFERNKNSKPQKRDIIDGDGNVIVKDVKNSNIKIKWMFNKDISAEVTGDNNVVIQGLKDSNVTINLNDPEEIRSFLIDFQNEIKNLPLNIIKMMKDRNESTDETLSGARLFLDTGVVIKERVPHLSEVTLKLKLTNFQKPYRFYHNPYFKLSKPIVFLKDTPPQDTFMLLPHEFSQVQNFPKKMEFGELLIVDYQINQNTIDVYKQLDDGESFIQAFIENTLGELYSSNPLNLTEFIGGYEKTISEFKKLRI